GQGTAIVAYDGGYAEVNGLTYYSEGFLRTLGIASQNANLVIKDSDITVMGADPFTEAWEGYKNSSDQNAMLSPPWPLGIMGGARVVNLIGDNSTLTVIGSTMTATAGRTWGFLSIDAGSNIFINVVDTEMTALAESEGGTDSGWRILGYDEDAYGSTYGTFYIGGPTEYIYGTTFNGVTYGAIICDTSVAAEGHYSSSTGTIDLYDANGNLIETVEGEGNVTTINAVYGFLHFSMFDPAFVSEDDPTCFYIEDGTVVNAEEAVLLYKGSNCAYYFDDAELNTASGILIQMMDTDDDDRIGGDATSVETGWDELYSDSKISSSGDGFPGLGYEYESTGGGSTLTATFTNGDYEGDILNGTGYYDHSADNVVVTIGEGATLTGDIALTSTIEGIVYSEEAIEGIEYYGDDIVYVLVDAEGNVTENEDEAAFIQFRQFTQQEYFLLGHVANIIYYNGAATAEVIVKDGGVWTVAEESLITKLTIEEGSTVYGTLTENEDGTLTLTPSDEVIPAGEYGTIEPVAAESSSSSGEASGEVSASGEASA
ncbi:MAG: hypothetical protein LUE21_07615, partial [Oscillospiraceae bacterium]|nr:hypothetical protein [Oscillospiraceae bacterium]